MKWFLLLLLGICFAAGAQLEGSYNGYKVYRVYPVTEKQQKFLAELQHEGVYDFWTEINKVGRPVDILVNPSNRLNFMVKMIDNGIRNEILMDDVHSIISQEKIANSKKSTKMSWTAYYTLNEIYDWLETLAEEYPTVEVVNAGKTYQNRDLKGVKISFKPGKKNVIIEGGIHAREWISPATVTFLINELLTSQDATVRKIAESFDWYLFPVTNPDGFSYTHTNDRLWRKTRTSYGLCSGADPNRNWDYEWGIYGTSSSSCSDTYGGPGPFSEIEMNNLANYFKTIGPNTVVYLGFHSYSQYLLIPYATKVDHQDNYDDLFAIGKKAIESLAARYGTKYIQGTAAEILYEVSGSSADWAKDQFKIPITYTYELRDTGRYGFLLPADQIIPNSLEVLDSVVAIISEAEKMGYLELD